MAVSVASSAATEWIGIHALFGAFLFGAILPKNGGLADALIERLESVAVVLLLPLFFAYSGLRTQINLVDGVGDWVVTGLIILLAALGKFSGSAVAARLTGLRWREAGAIGILMNTRGLMELIVLNIGLDLGVLSPTLFTMLVIMALVATFLTTPMVEWVYPRHELARDLVHPAELASDEGGQGAILTCVSDARSGPAMALLAHALLPSGAPAASVIALHLLPPSDRPSSETRGHGRNQREVVLQPLLEQAQRLALGVKPLSFVSAEPSQDICRTARAKEVGLILLGWHKPLLVEGRLGGVVGQVMEHADRPVGVLIDRGMRQVRRVLVPFVTSASDRPALQVARQLLHQANVELTLLHVVRGEDAAQATQRRRQVEQLLQTSASGARVHFDVVENASPSEAAIDAARGQDLVILAAGPDWGLSSSAISLSRHRILEDCPVSVLVVHSPPPVASPAGLERPWLPSPSSRTV